MPLTREEFNKIKADYLEAQDDERETEIYCTPYQHARLVLDDLENFLFREDIERQKRYAVYVELQKEFNPFVPGPTLMVYRKDGVRLFEMLLSQSQFILSHDMVLVNKELIALPPYNGFLGAAVTADYAMLGGQKLTSFKGPISMMHGDVICFEAGQLKMELRIDPKA